MMLPEKESNITERKVLKKARLKEIKSKMAQGRGHFHTKG